MIIGPVQSIDVTCSKSAENVALRASGTIPDPKPLL